ncbi:MAG TPA: hypothetical protein VIM41_04315 [Gammaproteobacteria bacterium]
MKNRQIVDWLVSQTLGLQAWFFQAWFFQALVVEDYWLLRVEELSSIVAVMHDNGIPVPLNDAGILIG